LYKKTKNKSTRCDLPAKNARISLAMTTGLQTKRGTEWIRIFDIKLHQTVSGAWCHWLEDHQSRIEYLIHISPENGSNSYISVDRQIYTNSFPY